MIDKKYKFRIEVGGFAVGGFMSCSALEMTTDNVEIDEGGSNSPLNEPGRTKYAPITLTRGVTNNEDFYAWAQAIADGEDDIRNLSIVQTNRKGVELKRWDLFGGWASKLKAGEWDAKASEAVVEEIEITYNTFRKG